MNSNRKWEMLSRRSFLGSEQGIVLIMALAFCFLVSIMAGAGMMTAGTDLKLTSNHKTGIEAFYIAEAGVELARQDLVDTTGLSQFLINGSAGTFPFGENPAETNHLNGGNYVVRIFDDNEADNDLTRDTNNRVFVESTGTYSSSTKRIVALVEVTGGLPVSAPRGAAEAYTSSGNLAEFDADRNDGGTAGTFDGRDWNPPPDKNWVNGNANACGAIATCGTVLPEHTNPSVHGAFTNSSDNDWALSGSSSIVGKGCRPDPQPPEASCAGTSTTSYSKSVIDTVAFTEWDNFLNQAKAKATRNESILAPWNTTPVGNPYEAPVTGPVTWGTRDNPEISVVTVDGAGAAGFHWDGQINGAGVLIIDITAPTASIAIRPTAKVVGKEAFLNWEGLVIVRSEGSVQFELGGEDLGGPGTRSGTARIFGQVVNVAAGYAELEFENERSFIKYSSAAMGLVRKVVPRTATVRGWREVM